MKHTVLTVLLLLALTGGAVAQSPMPSSSFNGYPSARWPTKEKPAAEDYKLSHDDFVTTYGVNDTAAAIIHMYLRKYTAGRTTVRIVGGATSAAGLLASAVADAKKPAPGPGQVNTSTDRDYPSWVYPVLAVGGGGVGFGLVQMATWSRREC